MKGSKGSNAATRPHWVCSYLSRLISEGKLNIHSLAFILLRHFGVTHCVVKSRRGNASVQRAIGKGVRNHIPLIRVVLIARNGSLRGRLKADSAESTCVRSALSLDASPLNCAWAFQAEAAC
jgi:hypothetical protein